LVTKCHRDAARDCALPIDMGAPDSSASLKITSL